jgi:hypothetical protein
MRTILGCSAILLLLALAACKTGPQTVRYLPDTPSSPLTAAEPVVFSLDTNTAAAVPGTDAALPETSPAVPPPREPEFVIDDFDTGVDHWRLFRTPRSKLDTVPLRVDRSDGGAFKLTYELPQKKQTAIMPDRVTVRIQRDCPFERYAGLQFYARAGNNFRVKVMLVERNELAGGAVEAEEIWFTEVTVTSQWKLFKIAFADFRPEEYFEQGFIGDDIQDLTRIRKVGFSIGNDRQMNERWGELCLDDVILF